MQVRVNKRQYLALVDTGCSQTIASTELASGRGGKGVVAVDGRLVRGIGEADVRLTVDGRQLEVACLVMANLVDGFKVIIGMDVIGQLGGATVDSAGCGLAGDPLGRRRR